MHQPVGITAPMFKPVFDRSVEEDFYYEYVALCLCVVGCTELSLLKTSPFLPVISFVRGIVDVGFFVLDHEHEYFFYTGHQLSWIP